YHLSMRISYPNAFDQARAADDGRSRLGGDIMIHGSNRSDGCIPVGDEAIEELFALTTSVGVDGVRVIVSPLDLRRIDVAAAVARANERPAWLPALYRDIAAALSELKVASPAAAVVAPRRLVVGRPRCRAYDERDCVRRCAAGDMASCARAGLMY